MTNSRVLSVRISLDLLDRLKKAAPDNMSAFCAEAIEEKLNPVKVEELTNKEKREVLQGAKNLSDLMQDLILQEVAQRKNFLKTMDNETFAKLVAARLPKELQDDGERDADVLSLESCLKMLPGVDDMTAELNKLKGLLHKTEHERDINYKVLEYSKGRVDLAGVVKTIYTGCVEYVVELVSRKNLPGFGDGGGLTDAGYSEIGEEVKEELNRLKVWGIK